MNHHADHTILPSQGPELAVSSMSRVQYGYAWMREAVGACQAADRSRVDPREELKVYLEVPLEVMDDIVEWWGVCHIYGRLQR